MFMKKPTVHLICNAHLDPVWLWEWEEGAADRKNCHFRARRRFSTCPDGIINIAAESFYALYVNGQFIGNGPARGTYTCNFVDTYDINQYLYESG